MSSPALDREAILGTVRLFREHCYQVESAPDRDMRCTARFALDTPVERLAQFVDLETTVLQNLRLMFNECQRRWRRTVIR
jgi:hypothetical protein